MPTEKQKRQKKNTQWKTCSSPRQNKGCPRTLTHGSSLTSVFWVLLFFSPSVGTKTTLILCLCASAPVPTSCPGTWRRIHLNGARCRASAATGARCPRTSSSELITVPVGPHVIFYGFFFLLFFHFYFLCGGVFILSFFPPSMDTITDWVAWRRRDRVGRGGDVLTQWGCSGTSVASVIGLVWLCQHRLKNEVMNKWKNQSVIGTFLN